MFELYVCIICLFVWMAFVTYWIYNDNLRKAQAKGNPFTRGHLADASCLLCADRTAEFAMSLCGHLVLCNDCATELPRKHRCPHCGMKSCHVRIYHP